MTNFLWHEVRYRPLKIYNKLQLGSKRDIWQLKEETQLSQKRVVVEEAAKIQEWEIQKVFSGG